MSDMDVMERLAAKLAAADLADDEIALLASLLAGSDEVSGFGLISSPLGTTATGANLPRDATAWLELLTARRDGLPPAVHLGDTATHEVGH